MNNYDEIMDEVLKVLLICSVNIYNNRIMCHKSKMGIDFSAIAEMNRFTDDWKCTGKSWRI